MTDHTEYRTYCRISYWKDGSAATSDEAWTHCKVTPLGLHSFGEQTFENTNDDGHRMRKLLSFLDNAYERGRSDAKREIRDVLGVKEPRS